MNQERINYEQLIGLAEQMKVSASDMEQILNEVKSLFNQIGGDAWSGTSATAAKEKFDMLANKFPEFYTATDKCYSHLVSVVENYKNIDTTVINS